MITLFYRLLIDLETVRPNAKISSHTTIKNYYPMIQENSEVELYLDELQTSKMQKSSTDSMEVMINFR
jgi:hypothetical protein